MHAHDCGPDWLDAGAKTQRACVPAMGRSDTKLQGRQVDLSGGIKCVKVKVKVYRSPPIASESPWPKPQNSTSG